MYYLSTCSIIKNEDPYIYENYLLHKALGCEFFLYYDRSDQGRPLTEIFKNHNDVKIINYPEPKRHAEAFADGIAYFQGKSRFVQFIDADEIVVPLNHQNDIKIMLQNYENIGSLGLNWQTFGSSFREEEPKNESSTYENYTWRAVDNEPINRHIQSIVEVNFAIAKRWDDPHHPHLLPNYRQVNENKIQFRGPFNDPISQQIGFIAHFYTRSRQYFMKKISKGRADTGTFEAKIGDFEHHNSYMNKIKDERVKNLWEKLVLKK